MKCYKFIWDTDMVSVYGLRGNELLAYSVINAYSQGEQGCFYGSIAFLAEAIGCGQRTALTTLQSLVKKGLIKKVDIYTENGKRCSYTTCVKIAEGYAEIAQGGMQKLHTPYVKIAPNNKSNIKDININYQKEKGIKERESDFRQEVLQHSEYPTEMLEDFIRYWGEPTTGRTPRMKWELQKTWSLGGRLATWAKHEAEWKRAPQSAKQTQGFHYSAEDKERAAALREQRQREEAERLAQMNN